MNTVRTKCRIKPIGNKTDKSKYTLYVIVHIYHNGVNLETVRVATPITVEKIRWDKTKVKGRDIATNNINTKLNEYLNITSKLLQEMEVKSISAVQDFKAELENNLSLRLFNKAKRGMKQDYISKLKTYTFENILALKLKNVPVNEERERHYHIFFKQLKEYFKGEIPTIDQITKQHLDGYKKWLEKKYTNKNTIATRLSYLCAIINYADEIGIITSNPIPRKYGSSFVDGNREILTDDECLKLIEIRDSSLTETECKAKYCLVTSLLTGIGYGDLETMEYENIKQDMDGWFFQKKRNKTDKGFRVPLSENALLHVKELIKLCGNDIKPFNLPDIGYTNRMYRKLGLVAGVDKKITTYTLRHTFSVDFMNKGGTLEDLKEMLGHTKLSTTAIYGKISSNRLSRKMKEHEKKSPIHQIQKNRLVAV